MVKHIQKHMAPSREYIANRGHMVSVLMMALMVTAWANNFQEVVGSSFVSTYF